MPLRDLEVVKKDMDIGTQSNQSDFEVIDKPSNHVEIILKEAEESNIADIPTESAKGTTNLHYNDSDGIDDPSISCVGESMPIPIIPMSSYGDGPPVIPVEDNPFIERIRLGVEPTILFSTVTH